jgi:uncharacterized protein (TIGR03435 family)
MIRIAVFLLLSIAALAEPADPPSFEVAAIKPGQPGRDNIQAEPGTVTMRNTSLSGCIRWAFEVQDYQISGPAWLDDARFDISAKAATPAKTPELRIMMQTLLAQRFGLGFHREVKEMRALILSVPKAGHKLQPTETEGSPSFKTGKMNLTGQGATVRQLTDFLSREIRTPVIDQTGLTGRFNYFLDIGSYISEEMRKAGGPPPDAESIIATAIHGQLGLKLEPKKAPVEIIVIDRLEKAPTEN